MADIRAVVKKYSAFSLILAIIILNVWLLNNGEAILPPEIYTQRISIIYGIILALVTGIWFITLYAEGRTHKIKELYDISVKDSIIGMVLGTLFIATVFWILFGVIMGKNAGPWVTESLFALIILHGLIVAPIETITAQKMVVDMIGYIPAALFFAGMHGAVYGFNLGTLVFAFTMGYIWSRLIGFKTKEWYYGIFGMGFVIASHATYNIMVTVYQEKMLIVLSYVGAVEYAWVFVALLLGIVVLFEVLRSIRVQSRLLWQQN